MAVTGSILGILALVLSIIGFVIVANVFKSTSASQATDVKIEGATFASDFEGKPVIVVNFLVHQQLGRGSELPLFSGRSSVPGRHRSLTTS